MDRTNEVAHVAAATQDDRLAVAANIGKQLYAGIAAYQSGASVQRCDRVVIADIGHHQLMADVTRSGLEQRTLLDRFDSRIEIPAQRKLCRRPSQRRSIRQVSHKTPE